MKRFFFFAPCYLIILMNSPYAQILYPPEQSEALMFFADQHTHQFKGRHQQALHVAHQKGWPVRLERDDGSVISLQQLTVSGMPMYYKTHNLNAAKTVSTDKVWPGGSTGYQLTGKNLIIGVWDGGAVRTSHQEFNGRATQVDGATQTIFHSTHVSGTLIAAGITPNAKGMAYEASLHAYDWDDDVAEIANAAANGLLISNHSYGYVVGWEYNLFNDGRWIWFGEPEINEEEDFYFGFYSDVSQSWDSVAYLAPDYLIVKSAGNDRNTIGPISSLTQHWIWQNNNWVLSSTKRNPDNIYNSVSHIAVAKNVLSIGAVGDIANGYSRPADAEMASFSCWGPTDDGRIKPDIVANGVSLYSTSNINNTSYGYNSGTSMAAPNAAGSLLLLQEQYQNTHKGRLMKAASLKALVIHTADEVGKSIGPDYEFGWGLLNTATAAEFIAKDSSENTILEAILKEGESFAIAVHADQSLPLRATLCWTDPPAKPPVASLNPTDKMLIHDLDLRLDDEYATHFPWILNPASPENPATVGDNITDNVEQVYISSPEADVFIVTVSHKNQLQHGEQAFSLIINAKLNAPPVVVNSIYDQTVREDFLPQIITDLTTVFNDPDSPSLNFTVQDDGNVYAAIDDNNLILSPVPDYNGSSQVVVTANDGYASITDTFQVIITSVNDAPILTDIPDISFNEDSSYTLPLNPYVSDVDHDSTAIHFVATVIDSTVLTSATLLKYEPGNLIINIDSVFNQAYFSNLTDSSGIFFVQFTALDDSGAADRDTIQVAVHPVNDPPAILEIPEISFDEDSSYVLSLNDFVHDPDNDTTEIQFSSEVIDATSYLGELEISVDDLMIEIDSLTNRARLYSHKDFYGQFTVQLAAVDPSGASDVDTLTVTIRPVNDPPVVKNAIPDTTIMEDSGMNLMVKDIYHFFADVDNAELQFSVATDSGLHFIIFMKSLFALPDTNYFGDNVVIITAHDETESVSDTVRIKVHAINDPPVLTRLPNVTFSEDSQYVLPLNPFVTDVDHDTSEIHFAATVILAKNTHLTDEMLIGPDDLSVMIDTLTNIATFTASADSAGHFAVEFVATDDSGATDADTISVLVNAVNDPPVILRAIADTSILEDSGINVIIENLYTVFTDADKQRLTFSITSDSSIVASITSDSLFIVPVADFFGTALLIVTASDLSYSVSDSVIITVENVNDPPSAFNLLLPVNLDTLAGIDELVTFKWKAAQDVDRDKLSYNLHIFSAVNDTMISSNHDTTITITAGTFWIPGTQYNWLATVNDGQVTIASSDTFVLVVAHYEVVTLPNQSLPEQYVLQQNYPNPFNPVTNIRFGLPTSEHVKLEIYNMNGQKIATLLDDIMIPGYHVIHFDARKHASGIYFYKLDCGGNFVQIKKMLLMK